MDATANRHQTLTSPKYSFIMEELILTELAELKRLALLSAKDVLTIDDVSLLTNISRSALYKMTSAREIPFYKRGKFVYFDRAELQAWMKENRVTPANELQQDALTYCSRNKRRG